jgi:phosphonate metabolism protein (transferase hexapeptide repeat family)
MTGSLGAAPVVHATAHVVGCHLGAYTEVGARTSLLETVMGDYSYIVNDSDAAYTEIGRFCSIAAHVRLNPGNHPMHRAAQSHVTYRSAAYWPGVEADEAALFAARRAGCVVLGHDVWIGHGAIVLPGRRIGTGAVIGAGAVVTRDVPPYAIAVGNPARVLRQRFAPAIAERLLTLAWWDWDHERLRVALPDFRLPEIEAFLDKYGS